MPDSLVKGFSSKGMAMKYYVKTIWREWKGEQT